MSDQQKREQDIAHRSLHPRGGMPVVVEFPDVAWAVTQESVFGPVLTTFAGPWAEWRARQYARARVLEPAAAVSLVTEV